MERRIVIDDLDCHLETESDRPESERDVAVTVNGKPIGRVRAPRSLSELSESDIRLLVERARKEAALERWEGEGGNPHPDGPS